MHARYALKISAFIVAIAASLFLDRSACYAALGVEPESIELVASPDTVTTGVYNVVNEGSEAVLVSVQPEEWPRNATAKSASPVEKWLTVTPMKFELAPQESKEVQYSINPPDNHGGEISAMVFFATSSPEGAMTITTRNGVSLYAAFADTMNVECSITGIDVAKFEQKTDGGIVDRGVIFTINIENKGNVHLRPTGSIAITGENDAKYELNIERGFPAYVGGKGSYQVLWDKNDIAPGKYEAKIMLDYGRLFQLDKKLYETVPFKVNNDRSVSL